MKRLLFALIFIHLTTFAVTTSEVNNNNIDGLMNRINQLNQDLEKKETQQRNLDRAIRDSDQALGDSKKLLNGLKQKRDMDMQQLNEIATVLPAVESMTKNTQKNVSDAIATIYQQIRSLQMNSQSVIAGNDTLSTQRKQAYLVQLLKVEQLKYYQLQGKLNQLNAVNDKLAKEVARLSSQLGATAKKQQQLLAAKQNKLNQVQDLDDQISVGQQQLAGLKQKQAELNSLLATLPNPTSKPHKIIAAPANGHSADASDNEEDISFFYRKLAKPLNLKPAIGFGAMRNHVKNNGALYNAVNAPIFSVSDGMVMYVGELPGFGNVIVINHGDNYMSVYGGILPEVRKGQNVTTGQVIANSGTKKNQLLGGVYFELRHYGRPVNPGALVN